jgi:GNAT superfamily N-acetyltransferase
MHSYQSPNIQTRIASISDLALIAPLFDAYRVFYGKPSNIAGARAFLIERFQHNQSIIFIAVKSNDSQVRHSSSKSAIPASGYGGRYLESGSPNVDSQVRHSSSNSAIPASGYGGRYLESGSPNVDTAIGFTQLYPSFSSVSMARIFILNDLYVDFAARRSGAARMLLKAAASYGHAVGGARLVLSTAIDNSAAQSLYAAQGWIREDGFYEYGLELDMERHGA